MNVVMKNVDELIPYENNPRINDHAVEYVINSIKEFGFKVPIVVDRHNVIVTGHTRLKAAKELEMEQVPVLVADDLSEEQIQAFRLADNKVGEIAEWDEDALAAELEELSNLDFNMELFDFRNIDHEVDIDDIFFNDEEQHEKDSSVYLKWGNNKTVLSNSSVVLLDNLLNEYNNAETNDFDFVQWLLTEGVANYEVDVS